MKKLFALTMVSLLSLHPIAQDFKSNARAKHITNNVFQLTPDSNLHGIAGTIWNLSKINLKYDFTLKTRIFFGYNDDGGDGLAFVLQSLSDSEVGRVGNGLGYETINPSLAVEFDTHYNPPLGDVEQDHLAFMLNGQNDHNSVNNLAPLSKLPNIENGQWHDVTFSWNASVHIFSVGFLSQTFKYSADIINTIFSGDPSVFWGFTGGTHEAANLQQIEIVSFVGCPFITFTPKSTPATCNQPNGTITVNALGGSGSYQYSKDNGATFQDSNEFFNLEDRTFQIVVKDKGGLQCNSDMKPVTITQTGQNINFTIKPTAATCDQSNGTITVNALGGSRSYQYSKDSGATFQDANVFSKLGGKQRMYVMHTYNLQLALLDEYFLSC